MVKDAMTPISETFVIDINAKLDRSCLVLTFLYTDLYKSCVNIVSFCPFNRDLMNLILEKGHSRVPVYYEQRTNIIGLVLV